MTSVDGKEKFGVDGAKFTFSLELFRLWNFEDFIGVAPFTKCLPMRWRNWNFRGLYFAFNYMEPESGILNMSFACGMQEGRKLIAFHY